MVNVNKLKASWVARGFSNKDIAEKLDVAESTIWRWLGNPDSMTVGTVNKMISLLGLTAREVEDIFFTVDVA